MKSLRVIFTVLCLLSVLVPAHSQRSERMYIADTLSNMTRARMFFAMAEDEAETEEKKALYRLSQGYFERAGEDSSMRSFSDSLDALMFRSYCCVLLDSIAPVTPMLQTALDMVADRYGAESLHYVDILRRTALTCILTKDIALAEELLDKCEEIASRSGKGRYDGFTESLYISHLSVRVKTEILSERYATALKYAKKAHEVMTDENILNDLYLDNLNHLVFLYGKMGSYGKAVQYNSMAMAHYRKSVDARLGKMSEARRNVYWESAASYFDAMLGSNTSDGYDACLFSKGLLLNTAIEFRNRVEQSGNRQAQEALAVMDSLVAAGADARQIDSVDLAMVRMLGGNEGITGLKDITWKDVREALGDDDLAIEFYCRKDGRYGALLLRKGWKAPHGVNLWTNKVTGSVLSALLGKIEIDAFNTGYDEKKETLHQYVNENDRDVSRSIWTRRIRRNFPITDEGRIFFSADGLLHQIGIEYLPLFTSKNSNDRSTIMDHYKIYRLSSTREVVLKPDWNSHKEGSASLYGGAMFNPPKNYLSHAVSLVSRTDSSLVDREYERRTLEEERNKKLEAGASKTRYAFDKEYIEALPATIREVHEIDSVLLTTGTDTRLYTGVYANEESFKSKTAGREIIHIATHGFYVSASEALSKNQYYKARFAHNPAVLADPLYRSGFHLAGATPAWAGLSNYVGLEDGVMTAKEVSLMDFSSADLVVLSACRTGVGDVSRDGVYGLQRAFKNAGAKSIIMSLWEVDDDATYMMMSCFYKNRYVLGMSKYEAFAQAQRQLRQKYDDPYYWRAFILLDPEF